MNFLTDEFPEAIQVGEKVFAINTDFRVGLEILLDFEDPELDDYSRQILMIKRLYSELPEEKDYEAAAIQAVKYLNGGNSDFEGESREAKPRVYSFKQDGQLIYAAFHQTHHIDLKTEKLHWWKFLALFMDLGADTHFNSLVNMRSRYYEGKATDDEKAYLLAEPGRLLLQREDELEMSEEEMVFRSLLPNGEGFRF